jgi:hypothetical protein
LVEGKKGVESEGGGGGRERKRVLRKEKVSSGREVAPRSSLVDSLGKN